MTTNYVIPYIQTSIDNGDIKSAVEYLDASLSDYSNISGTNNKEDILKDAYTLLNQIKGSNKSVIEQLQTSIDEFENDINENNNLDLNAQDIRKLQTNVETSKEQNDHSMKTFLETYLYLIIKVIFVGILILLAVQISSYSMFSLSFSSLLQNAKQKIGNISDKTSELKNKTAQVFENVSNKREPKKKNDIDKMMNNTNNTNNNNNKKTNANSLNDSVLISNNQNKKTKMFSNQNNQNNNNKQNQQTLMG